MNEAQQKRHAADLKRVLKKEILGNVDAGIDVCDGEVWAAVECLIFHVNNEAKQLANSAVENTLDAARR